MTENKRFELAPTNNKGWVVLDRGNILWRTEILSLLNELHEENEELKRKHYNELMEEGVKIERLREENKELKKENEQLQRYVYHCPQTCRIILAYLKKCGSENVEAVNKAMDNVEYFDEEVDTLRL